MRHLFAIVRLARASFPATLSWRLLFAVVLGAVVGVVASMVPALIGLSIRGVMPGGEAAPARGLSAGLVQNLAGTPWWVSVMVALIGTLIAVGLTLWSSKVSAQLAGEVTAALRIAMLRRAVHASARALDEAGAALMSAQNAKMPGASGRPMPNVRGTDMIKLAVTRDAAQIAEFLVAVFVGLPQAVAGLVTLGYDMVASGAWFALAGGTVLFVLSRLGAERAARRVSAEMRGMQQADGSLFSQLGDTIGAIEDLRLLGARDQAMTEFALTAQACADAKARVSRAIAMSGQIKTTFTAISPLLIVVALHFVGGNLPAGDIAKLLLLVPLLMTRLDGLDGLRNGLSEREPVLAAARHVLELPEHPPRPKHEVHVEPAAVKGAILFERVSFSPPGANRKVIDQLDLMVPGGSIVGLCGDTGCGKSTLLRLLLRLDDPDEGRILLDGTDLRSIDPDLLPRIFGVLGQSSRLFERTIEHNLSLGLQQKPSVDSLGKALRRVKLDSLSAAQSSEGQSLQTVYRAQPPNLSGGEQRRVLLARMLVRDAHVFVLDEPEAGLPSALAEELLRGVGEIAAGRTCLVVTHAPHLLSSTFNAVLDAGKVIATGPHDELASSCEPYRNLLAKVLKRS